MGKGGGFPMEDLELKTAGGYLIKIKGTPGTCIVFSPENIPEVHGSGIRQSMEQPIPTILFLGRGFRMVIECGSFVLVKNQFNKVRVPYRHAQEDDEKFLNVSCPSRADQYPVFIRHFESVKHFIAEKTAGEEFRFIFVGADIPRIDMMSLRVKHPDAQILALQRDINEEATSSKNRPPKPDRELLLKEDSNGESTRNPVFLARMHLRRMDLGRVKDLILETRMSVDEMQFVRKFLQIMVQNSRKKEELGMTRQELERLDEIYRLTSLLAAGEKGQFDQELEKMDPKVASEMIDIIAHFRNASESKSDEIQFWEWEYRLKRLGGKS